MLESVRNDGIQMNLFQYFNDAETFTLKEAQEAVLNHYKQEVKVPSIRARIYEGIDKGLFTRVAKGVYTVTKKDVKGVESTCLLVNGDGRDLSFIEDNSIDALITDHPYKIDGALKGGNRDFATYDLFKYEQKDFDEKCRVLKPGAFLVEFLPEESEVNYEYLYQVKTMAKNSGFKYFAKVPWKKGNFVANTGRTMKNREDIMFFSKGEPRALKLDTKKNKGTALAAGLDVKGLDSYQLRDLLEERDLQLSFMKGAAGMLPTEFDHQPRNKNDKVMEAEKPVELFDEILPYITLPGEKVLDQFAGSGNLGISAVKNGRDAILIEKDEINFNKMKDNIANALKQKAELKTEIEEIYYKIDDNIDKIKIEQFMNGDTFHVSQLECENKKLELAISDKEDKVEVLTAEAECYSEVLSINGMKMDISKGTLDCSAVGNRCFSDEYALVTIHGCENSIEEIFKTACRKRDGSFAAAFDEIAYVVDPYTGDKLPAKAAADLYKGLWITYLNNNPDLVKTAAEYKDYKGSSLPQNKALSSAKVIKAYVEDQKQFVANVKESGWYKNMVAKIKPPIDKQIARSIDKAEKWSAVDRQNKEKVKSVGKDEDAR